MLTTRVSSMSFGMWVGVRLGTKDVVGQRMG
jgi:hypothetical protein